MSTPDNVLAVLVPTPLPELTLGGERLALQPVMMGHYLALEKCGNALTADDKRPVTWKDIIQALAMLTLPAPAARALAGRDITAVDLRAADIEDVLPVAQRLHVFRAVLTHFDQAFATAPATTSKAEASAEDPLPRSPAPTPAPAPGAPTAG